MIAVVQHAEPLWATAASMVTLVAVLFSGFGYVWWKDRRWK